MGFLKNAVNRWLPVFLVMAPFLGVGAVLGTYPGYRVYTWVWKDPAFCFSCHVHDYATTSWKDSAHGKLTTCHDCHHQALHDYIREAFIMVTHLDNPPRFPRDLHHTPHVPRDLCEACHLSRPEDRSTITGPLSLAEVDLLPKVDRMKLHIAHLGKKVKLAPPTSFNLAHEKDFGRMAEPEVPERRIQCMDCHGAPPNRSHHFTVAERTCLRCHAAVHQKSAFTAAAGCRSCHFQEFLTPVQ